MLRHQIRDFAAGLENPLLPVPTPELSQWDGQIFVRRISAREWAQHWQSLEDEDANERAQFCVQVACDGAGERIFADEDAQWLGASRPLVSLVERLYWAGRHHNGMTDANRSAFGKNSDGTGRGGSPSSSAAPSPPATAST